MGELSYEDFDVYFVGQNLTAEVFSQTAVICKQKKENHPFKKAQGKNDFKIIRLIKSNYNFKSTDKKVILSFSQKKCN